MKKLFIILLLLWAGVAYGASTTLSGTGSTGLSTTGSTGFPIGYDDITFYHDCNAQDSANKASGSSSITYDAAWGLDSSNAAVGTAAWTTAADSYDNIYISTSSNISLTSGRIGFYWRQDDTDNGGYLVVTDVTGDCELSYFNSGSLQLTYMGTYTYIDYGTVTQGTWYFIEISFDSGTATLYKDGSSLGSTTGTTAITATSFRFGNTGSSTAFSVDQVISSSSATRDLYALRAITDFD